MKYSAYPSYKDSGVEWLGKIPEGWGAKKLKFISTINDETLSDNTSGDLEINYIDIGSVTTGYIQDYERMTYSNAPSRARRIVKNGDVLVSTVRTYLKAIAPVAPRYDGYIASTGFAVIRSGIELDSGFTKYAFLSNYFVDLVESRSVGVSYPAINSSDLAAFCIATPPLQEQQTIANYLDKATAKIDTLIAKQTRLIALLKEKRQAVISTSVTRGLDSTVAMKDSGVEWLGEIPEGWETSKLRYVFSFGKGLTITKANLEDKGIPCVNYGEIHSKYGFEVDANKHDLKYVDESYLVSDRSSLLSMGDFIFADTSEDIEGAGNFTHVSSQTQLLAGYHTVIARQVGDQNFRFLAYLIDSETFRVQIRLAVKGVKVFSITQAILRASLVWLPKANEQQTIANYLDKATAKIDNLITKSTQAITLLKEKRTALISSAVTGKIDVRNT